MKAQDDAFKHHYWKRREEERSRTLTDSDRSQFRDMGYTEEQIKAIEGAL